jgi:hypothetical protein
MLYFLCFIVREPKRQDGGFEEKRIRDGGLVYFIGDWRGRV